MAKSFNSIKAGWKNTNTDVNKKKSFKDIKSADYDFGIDESRINSFLKNAKEYFDNVDSDASSVNYNNAESKYHSNQEKIKTLGDEAGVIRAYYNANKSKIDTKTYNSMMEYLDAFEKGTSDTFDYYRKKASEYSKFETEAEYNDAVKISELYNMPSAEVEKQMGFSRETYETDLAPLKEEYDQLNSAIRFYGRGDRSKFKTAKDYNDAKIRRDELKKQITDLQGKNGIAYTTSSGQNITWKSLYDKKKDEEDFNALYGELSSAEDWGEKSKYKQSYDENSAKSIWADTDIEYETINGFVDATKDSNYSAYEDKSYADVTTKDEKAVFNYLYHTQGKETAMEWHKSRTDIYEKRRSENTAEFHTEFAKKLPVLSDALAIYSSVAIAPMEYLANTVTGKGGETTKSAAFSSTVKGTRMEQIDLEVGGWDVFDFLYGTGTSMAESALAMTLYGGYGGYALGLSAAAQGTNDALNRGMSKGQAFASGVASGIFEGLFESWSIGAFGDLTKNLKRADFRNLAKYVGKNMWNNAKEETLTEIANIAYDYLVNGDFSQYETAIRQYMASGMSESDAKVKVAMELGRQVVEAAGSGALMGFGFGVGGSAGVVKNTIQSGKLIKDAGETRNLVDLGKSLGEGTESYKLADKITDKSSAYAIGKLYGIEADDIANANKTDMIKAFEEKGFNSKEASVLVNKILEQGSESVSNIRGMVSPQQVYNDVLNDPNSTVSQREEAYRGILQGVAENRLQKAISKAVKNKSAIASHKASTEEQGNLPTQEENPVESKFESNPEGKDFNTSSGKIITSKKLVASNKDNMAFEVTYDDGTTENVDANDISFGNEGEALVYSAVMNMNLPVGVAEQLISGYNGNDVNSAGTYINGVREAFVFGKHNQEADLHNGAYASQLTEEQRSNAFKLGKIYANEKAIADEKAIQGETKPTDIKKREGKLHFEGDKLSLTSVQDVSVKSLEVLTEAIGKDIHIFESYVDKNGKRVYKDANGNIKSAPNGFYNQVDGSIWIDLNAGNRGQGVMMYTVAHELTHFIKQWSPTKFKALADFLVEQYGKEGVSVHQLVLAQQKKAKDNGRNISYDVAFEEMVADSMETMLTDGKVIRELAHKDKGLFDKIKSWIDNLLRRLNKEYKNYAPESNEGQMIFEAKETFKEVQRLFTDALVDASDNFAIKGTDVGFIQKNMITETGKLSGIMDSTRTETEPMPKMVMDMTSGNGGKLFTDLATNYLIKGIGDGGAVNGYTVAQIREAIMKANGFDAKQIRNVQAFMKSMADFMDEAGVKYRFIGLKDVEDAKLHYSYNADGSIKSVVLSAMVKNGDYPVNFDFSSICKKRVAMSKLINKLCDMGAMDKGTVNLSPKNIFEINKALKNEGFETACLGCFVESKRYNIQEWANSFIKKWNEAVLKVNPNATYFGFTDGKTNFDNLTSNQVFAIDKAAQTFLNKTGKERRDKAKAVYEEKAKNGEALLEKLPKSAIEKIKKSQSLDDSMKDYFLSTDPKAFTLEDVNLLIDNEILAGKSISNKLKITKMVESGEQFQHLLRPSDLLTERGITQLEQLPNFHGILYGHYGSGTPKLVQGFTPYNSEIALLSEKKGDKTLAEYLYSIAGVRMQSFSDFQIQNIFDYLQMIADLSARKLPAHAYTKEISFAKLLGMTGIKTNLSVMFDIDTSVDDAHAGLTKYNPSIHQGEYAKIVLEDEQGKWVYNIGDYATQKAYEDYAKMMGNKPVKRFLQSIGFADAVKLQTTEGYTKNCGIIGVGYSDAHILAMLNDPRIRYIIPYHSSSLPHEIKVATNIEKGTDYTSTQNTMKIVRITDKNGNVVDWSIKEAYKRLNSGKAVIEELNKHIKEDGWVVETKKAQNGHGTYDLYGDLANTSDPRMTADNFMSWCAKNGSLPLFYQFADHNNYYKMLYDFNVYDNVTEEYAPQGAVTNTYPTGANVGADVVSGEFNEAFFKETVENYMQIQNDFNARLDDTIDELAEKIVNNTMPDADFGVMNSLREIVGEDGTNYGVGVYLDSQKLDGLSDKERIDKVREHIEKLGGHPFSAFDNDGNEVKIKVAPKTKYLNEKGKWERANRHLTNFVIEKEKQETLILIDEIISAATFKEQEPAKHNHGWLDNNGKNEWDIWTTYIQDKENTIWEAKLKIANTTNGEKVLYDVYPIEKVGPGRTMPEKPTEDKIPQNTTESQDLFSERDSNGNTLTKEQTEFFKDSKVRDKDGNLKVVYHGTPNRNVNTFSYDYVGSVGGNNHGYGFYFTDNKNDALLYAQGIGELKESYINITNPIYSESTDLESKLDELFERLPMYAKNTLKAEYGNVDSAKQHFREYISKHKNGTFLAVFPNKANIHPEVFNNLVLANMGYDGIVYEEDGYSNEYVVFKSNQSKVTSNTNPTMNPDFRYSVREEAPPKKTETVYKLMKLGDDGKLYPLFIDGGSPVELGVWYNADSPSFENLKDLPSGYHLVELKTGKTIVSRAKKPSKAEVQYADNNGRRWMFIKDAEEGSSSATRAAKQYGGNARFYYNVGINGSGSVSEFALRPGWHAGSLPVMEQIGNTSMRNIRADNFVWVEGEISYDIDYQKEAESNPSGENDIPFHIPKDGAYIKGTSNFVTKGMTWYIAGAFKANKIIGDREARKIIDNFNENIKDADAPMMNYDFPRNNGRIFNAETMSLEEGNEYEVRHWERARDTQKQKTLAPDDTMPIRFSERVLMGSLFSGGGTLEAGLVYQMLDKEFAVEFNKQIASVYTDNHGKEHMFVGDVRDFNSKEKRNVFYLHASPVCKNFSSASHSGGETTLDITTAQATARVLEEQMPQVFTVENVKRYIGSEAYNIITNKLDELGYTWDVDVYKASNYGNATKRERMIIRAVKSGELPAKPQKVSNITSWGEATRDLWETDLIPSNLVRSKIEAIKNTPGLKGVKLTKLDKPLLIYDTTKGKQVTYAWADELAPTLTTKCGDARIIMPDGRVYAPTPKFMGRIQGLPDNYKYPKATTRAFTIIGNGIPTQLTKAVMGGVLDSAYEQTHNGEVLYSERDTDSVSTRSLLANALEGTALKPEEKNLLRNYKTHIRLIEGEQKKLHEVREKLFTKGVNGEERKKLQFEAKLIATRINSYDKELFKLEAMQPMKDVLAREKELARKRQKQKDAENLKEYKEKVAETTRQLLDKNRQSRERAIEGRNKTEMRHKVKKIVNDLNNLLLKPTKERHIPEEMRVAVAEALYIVNMDTVDAETRVAHYNDLIAKANDPDVVASLTETRDRILNQGNKLGEKLAKLKDAYAMINASADENLKSMYDDVIYSKIESVQKKVGKTPLRNMTLEQLESVYELYKMVFTTVRDSNKAFAEDLKMTRQALGSNTFAEIKDNNKERDRIKFESIEKFGWKNLKPIQAMKTIGSSILQQLWNNILYGQEVFAQDYDEAVKFAKEMKEKYGYNEWNLDKLYSFESKSGKVMKINLEQMMSIYAYSKRKQADEHIENGGILLNESIIKEQKFGRTVEVKVNDSTAYRLNKTQVNEIIATLEKEFPGAKDFVDEMQKYLSETMGEKGNEVSMKMYGIKLFKEEHYFPLKSSKDFMESANAKLKGDVKIKNKGMTKATVEHASNPIVLEGFLDVWANHINEMAMYHGLVLPLEDFSRTLNYGFKADDKVNADAESVRTALRSAFGESADNYLNELLKAINGGVLHDSSTELADKMVSRFKKAKVMASLSVIVQQPTAIVRAMGIIEPKYFVAQDFHHKQTWEELKKYCPTAIIKETGSFDTNMGRTIVDMVKEDRKFTEKVGDTLGKAPAWMDEMGWNMIWRALKKKVATEQNLSGEALLKECGKQMTLIINETQVYDSVMSRNELMRSKSTLTKMATAFMGEPSTVANMIYGAALDIKRGKKGIASKTIAAVISSVVINGLVSSLVYAFRDDDEEKTWLEKYLESATTEVIDGINLLTYIPYIKDAYSLFQGYDVERTDMALIGDVVDALDDFFNVFDPEAYEDTSSGEIAKHIYESSVPLLTSICDMFGLPVGNILRDAKSIIVNDNLSMSKTSGEGTGLAIKEGWLNSSPKFVGKFVDDEKYHKLYLIANNGDTAYVKNEVAEMVVDKVESGKTKKEAKQSVKSSFTSVYRDEYKKAYKNKDSEEMNRIRKFLYATGLWDSLTELDNLLANWRKAD